MHFFLSFQVVVVISWILAVGMNWTLLYGLYPYNKESGSLFHGGYFTPVWLMELKEATCRTVWALSCAWIVYACMTGWGGEFCRETCRFA